MDHAFHEVDCGGGRSIRVSGRDMRYQRRKTVVVIELLGFTDAERERIRAIACNLKGVISKSVMLRKERLTIECPTDPDRRKTVVAYMQTRAQHLITALQRRFLHLPGQAPLPSTTMVAAPVTGTVRGRPPRCMRRRPPQLRTT